MKTGIFILLLCLFARCGECDSSSYYQIKSVTPDATIKWKCRYIAEGLGPCASWQKTQQIVFADTCRKFVVSQILSRAQVSAYK